MGFILINNISDIIAESCGTAILNPGWIHQKRNLESSVLILGHQGTVSIREEKEKMLINPSRMCILSKGKTHWGDEAIDQMVRYFWIHFRSPEPPEEIEEKEAYIILQNPEIAKQRLKNTLLLPRQSSLENPLVTRNSFRELLFEQQKGSFTRQKYQSLFRILMITLNEMIFYKYQKKAEQQNKSLENKIIQIIYENLTDPCFCVKQLSDIMGYNPDYLNRHFKKIMKQSLIEYIVDKRIEHALPEMIESNKSLNDIACNAGFSSYRNFIHQFKQRKNMIPSEFRNRYRMMYITNH